MLLLAVAVVGATDDKQGDDKKKDAIDDNEHDHVAENDRRKSFCGDIFFDYRDTKEECEQKDCTSTSFKCVKMHLRGKYKWQCREICPPLPPT